MSKAAEENFTLMSPGKITAPHDSLIDPRLDLLEDISKIVGSTLDANKLLHIMIDSTTRVMRAEACSLLLLDEERKKLYFEVATGELGEEIKKFEVPLGEGIAGWVAQRGEPLLVPDVHKDTRWMKSISRAIDFETRSMACVPMKIDDEVIGVVQIINRLDGRPFDERDVSVLTAFAKVASNTIKNARSFQLMSDENVNLRKALSFRPNIIFGSDSFRQILNSALKAAKANSTVLITGESGTGKELVARYIHDYSKRKEMPFIVVNCAAIPETLIESELFGHEKGAFTGAVSRQTGKFELANGGTIFLDEIGDMPLSLQVKLLRVLQESEIERVGGHKTIRVDVRVIAATNVELVDSMERGAFRKDLYYRLNVVNLHLPPLRDRREDIPMLVDFYLKQFSEELKKNFTGISDDALKCLMEYEWKGNVRELKNLIDRIVTLEEGPLILPEHLQQEMKGDGPKNYISVGHTLKDAVNLFKRDFIGETLKSTGGNQTRAAKVLDIQRSYLSRLAKELGAG